MPPVSTTSNGTPRHSACCAIRSRVVPAIAVTIARRVPVMRLKSVDLPTFGRPTSTTDGRRRGTALNLIGSVRIAEPDADGPAVGQRDLLDEGERRAVAGGIADHRVGLPHLEEPVLAEASAPQA